MITDILKEGRYCTLEELEEEFGWNVYIPNTTCRCGAKLEMRRGLSSCPACRKKAIARIRAKVRL